MTTWSRELIEALAGNGETWEDVIETTLTQEEMYSEFDDGFGLAEGCPFTLWTNEYVYFPVQYDGSEWVASVPRNPCNEPTQHIGG